MTCYYLSNAISLIGRPAFREQGCDWLSSGLTVSGPRFSFFIGQAIREYRLMARLLLLCKLKTLSALLLVLDDDDDDCVMLTQLIKTRFGERLSLVCTTSQADFLAHLAPGEPLVSLILLDYHLPPTTSRELIPLIRAQAGREQVPVVVWSAQASAQAQQACLAQGASEYLSKVAGVEQLSQQLSQLVLRYLPAFPPDEA
ncbi:response regulator [Spirosoma fluviale]|uniref:response regulator n=1 Tax=Spirosoma fluviale TaxID=1597977 RepID=UPI001FE96211|nr:response regulator [Spirosoma fluviale]